MITKGRGEGRDEGVVHFSTIRKRVYSLAAPETVAPRGCTRLLCSSCCFCCWTAQEGSQSLKVASNATVTDGDASMAPSAPVPLAPPPPPVASAAATADPPCGDGINGHSQVPTVKLPGKSSLKQQSSPSANGSPNGTRVSRAEENVANAEPGEEYIADAVVTEPEKRDCKVQWIDNFGKDLTQVHEFEPSDSGDSEDDDDDEESSQACTCVIQ